MACPCGLTQEKLDAHNWVDNDRGLCTAPFKFNGVTKNGCGELYASHPSTQGRFLLISSLYNLLIM